MFDEIEAIYENGVLWPLVPLPLSEREHVTVTVSRAAENDWLDAEFMDACVKNADPSVTVEQVQSSLANIRGSMDDVTQADRGDF